MDASWSVGVADSVLRRWVQQLGELRQGRTLVNPAMTADPRRIQMREARITRLAREKTILKSQPHGGIISRWLDLFMRGISAGPPPLAPRYTLVVQALEMAFEQRG